MEGGAETNKIMGTAENAHSGVEGICVRVSAMRCHSQALTIKLKRDIPLAEIEKFDRGRQRMGQGDSERARCFDQGPVAGSGERSDDRAHRSLAQLSMGGEYLAAFTVGDQLALGRRRAAAPDYAIPASACVSRLIGTDSTCQISLQYSRMVRSDEELAASSRVQKWTCGSKARIAIHTIHLVLTVDIGLKVGEQQVGVVMHQAVDQRRNSSVSPVRRSRYE